MGYSNDMVAHIWANQSKESAESNNGNFYFSGRVLYSYGAHYIVGIMAHDGRAILNSDSSTMTTSGKHKPAAWRAVDYRALSIPSLTGIYRAILSRTSPAEYAGQWMSREMAERELRAYLEANAAGLSDDAGAYLYALISRGDWSAYAARAKAKAAKAKERAAKAASKAARAEAAQWAAMTLPAFRARLASIAGNDSDYSRQRQFKEMATELYHAHRAAGGARIKAAVWQRLQMTRAAIARDERRGPGYRATRKAIATLRQIQAGDVRGLSWRTIRQPGAWTQIVAHIGVILDNAPAVSPALRARLVDYRVRADRIQRKAAARQHRVDQAERRRAEAERFAREAEARRDWLAGLPVRFYGRDETGGALLRAVGVELDGCNVRAGTLQTSQGAEVPLSHAVRAFRFVKAVRASGEAWEAAGRTIAVGHFRIDRIEATGDFRAGCHFINWPEIERLALELGVFDCPATSEAEAAGSTAEAA